MRGELQITNGGGQVYHPDYGQLVNFQTHDLPDDPDGQVEETIRLMTGYVNADRLTHEVRRAAEGALRGGMGMDPLDALHSHVRNSMRFKYDDEISGRLFGKWDMEGMGDVIEVISRPFDTALAIERGFSPEEDCDGFSTYVAGLLAALDIPCSFVTVGADPEEPNRYSHVYVAAYPKQGQSKYAGERVVLDCSHGAYAGWECPNRYGKFREWPVYGRTNWMGLALVGIAAYGLYRYLKGKPVIPAFAIEAFKLGEVA